MDRSIRGFAAISGLVLAIGLGHAATARANPVYDTSLADPPGVYFGTGNSNSHWTVNTQGGVELGLQALNRYVGPVTPQTGTSIYNVSTGVIASPYVGSLWDIAFSVNLRVNGANSDLTLNGITTKLTVVDEANVATGSIDALLFPDNYGYGSSGSHKPAVTSDYGFQNSQPLSYNSSGTADGLATYLNDPNFSAYQNDTFLVTFSATNSSTGASLGSVSETIVAGTGAPVPEPGDLAILGVGLLGLAVAHRAGRRQASVRARTSH